MAIILNKTTKHLDRYYLINGCMGCYGEPESSPNHKYEIANGVNRGYGYQGYMSVTYALSNESYMPKEVKNTLISILKLKGYSIK